MPTFYAQKTTIQLSVADLGRAAPANPCTQQSIASSESIRSVAQEFAKGSKNGTLTETPFHTEDGSHVRFLGKHGDMPFFMVHAGKNFFDLTTKEKRNRRPARVPLTETGQSESAPTAADLAREKVNFGTGTDCKKSLVAVSHAELSPRAHTPHQATSNPIRDTNHLSSPMLSVSLYSSPLRLLHAPRIERLRERK